MSTYITYDELLSSGSPNGSGAEVELEGPFGIQIQNDWAGNVQIQGRFPGVSTSSWSTIEDGEFDANTISRGVGVRGAYYRGNFTDIGSGTPRLILYQIR